MVSGRYVNRQFAIGREFYELPLEVCSVRTFRLPQSSVDTTVDTCDDLTPCSISIMFQQLIVAYAHVHIIWLALVRHVQQSLSLDTNPSPGAVVFLVVFIVLVVFPSCFTLESTPEENATRQ